MPNIFYSSDGHWSHENIIRYCDRPFKDYTHMNEMMVQEWNKVVGTNDIVRYGGDFSLGGPDQIWKYRERLNGHWELFIQGNHDRSQFLNMPGLADKVIRGKFSAHYSWHEDNIDICFSHYPIENWTKLNPGKLLLFGHTHQKVAKEDDDQLMINVGVDAWNYRPAEWSEIKALIS